MIFDWGNLGWHINSTQIMFGKLRLRGTSVLNLISNFRETTIICLPASVDIFPNEVRRHLQIIREEISGQYKKKKGYIPFAHFQNFSILKESHQNGSNIWNNSKFKESRFCPVKIASSVALHSKEGEEIALPGPRKMTSIQKMGYRS